VSSSAYRNSDILIPEWKQKPEGNTQLGGTIAMRKFVEVDENDEGCPAFQVSFSRRVS
jgi:hypothetical protein